MIFSKKLEKAESLSEIFEVIKEIVKKFAGRERAGLMLGLADLGILERGFVGAFYPVGSNLIVVNKSVIKLIETVRPELLKDYCFGVLLHEYLHTLGIMSEYRVDVVSYMICLKAFGKNHRVTRAVRNIRAIMSMIVSSVPSRPVIDLMHFINNLESLKSRRDSRSIEIEILNDFDQSSTSYIG